MWAEMRRMKNEPADGAIYAFECAQLNIDKLLEYMKTIYSRYWVGLYVIQIFITLNANI